MKKSHLLKSVTVVTLLAILCMTLFGCAQPESQTSTTTTTTPAAPSEPENNTELVDLLTKRNLPELKTRDEMLEVMQREVYGYMPAAPEKIEFTEKRNAVSDYCAGKAFLNKVTATCTVNGQEFSFPFYVAVPNDGEVHPFIVHINFRSNETDRYQPTEELIDNGFAVLSFNYKDITSDDSDFTNGLAGILFEDGKREADDPGKIAMWAWAAQRVMDYAETIDYYLDLDCAIVAGHSRLGKTALLAAATDERFDFAYSNDSGCSGAAIMRGKTGEGISRITSMYPYWFCDNYFNYVGNVASMPFDQHYLVASIAPRKVLIGSAEEDTYSDPLSEQLCVLAASPAFENGFNCTVIAEPGDEYFDGDIGYHIRSGKHYFSREDWHKLMKFVKLKYPME